MVGGVVWTVVYVWTRSMEVELWQAELFLQFVACDGRSWCVMVGVG